MLRLVPEKGVEPSRPKAPGPKPGVAAISPLRLATGQREQGVARFPAWPHPVLSDRLDDDYSTTDRRLMSTDDGVIAVTFCFCLSSPRARTETRPSPVRGSSGSLCQ